MSDYKIVYVTSGTPSLDGVDLPVGVTWCSTQYAEQECGSSARENTIWVVRAHSNTATRIRRNGVGYISTHGSRNTTDWLNRIKSYVDNGTLGFAADPCDKRQRPRKTMAPCVTINSNGIIDKPFVGASIKPPATPHTTLVTQVDIHEDTFPLDTTLEAALNGARLEDDGTLPEDGMITIKWEKVAGRDQLRKFTVTVDYKESN